MTPKEALKHFKTRYELCKKIGAVQSNFNRWEKQNWIPVTQQLKINQTLSIDLPIDLDKESMKERLERESKK